MSQSLLQEAHDALERQKTWHEARKKELSKSGRSHGAIGWDMLQHDEEINELQAAMDKLLAAIALPAGEPLAYIERRFVGDEMVHETVNRDPMPQDQLESLRAHYRVVVIPLGLIAPNSELATTVDQATQHLLDVAKAAGVVVTIERRALPPLAMGNAEYVIETRPVRVAS